MGRKASVQWRWIPVVVVAACWRPGAVAAASASVMRTDRRIRAGEEMPLVTIRWHQVVAVRRRQ
jgi:hypothetical protein